MCMSMTVVGYTEVLQGGWHSGSRDGWSMAQTTPHNRPYQDLPLITTGYSCLIEWLTTNLKTTLEESTH